MRTERPTVLAGRYVLDEELGRSALGIAWRATDAVLDRQVVVKLIQPALAQDPEFAERLASRTRAVALLAHPGLARLLDVGTDQGVTYLISEYVAGPSVREMLEQSGPCPPVEAARIVASVLDTLGEVDSAGLLHLPLTPANVFVSNDGAVRLTDVAVSDTVDAQTEIWSAGALLYELLTGERPSKEATSPRSIRKEVPRELDAAVGRSLSSDPRDRFDSAQSFARTLRAIADTGGGTLGTADKRTVGAAARLPAEARSVFRTWLAVPLVLAIVTAVAVVVGLSLGKLEIGGPVGIRPKREAPRATIEARVLPASAEVFDPLGDDQENDSGVSHADDGDPATVWKSENYFDGQLHKAGVGLLFDLGDSRNVTGFRLETPYPGFEFSVAVGDDPTALTAQAGPTMIATSDDRREIGPVTGRYVLLWFTTVVQVDDGHRVEIAEFYVLGS
ncbi:MAG: protein kinase [Actinomycetota bacterium]